MTADGPIVDEQVSGARSSPSLGDRILAESRGDADVAAEQARAAMLGTRAAVSLPIAVTLAVAAGVAWALAAPPRGWWPLLPLGVTALTIAVHDRGLRARMLLGPFTGVVLYSSTLVWLTDFATPGYVAVVLLETVMLAVAVGLVPTARVGRWSGGWWGLPGALVLLDVAQTRFPFDGFPLPALVLSQLDGPFALAAPLGGSLLVTAVAATAGVGLAAVFLARGMRRLVAVGIAIVVAGVPLAAGTAVTTAPVGALDAAVVQGVGPEGFEQCSRTRRTPPIASSPWPNRSSAHRSWS